MILVADIYMRGGHSRYFRVFIKVVRLWDNLDIRDKWICSVSSILKLIEHFNWSRLGLKCVRSLFLLGVSISSLGKFIRVLHLFI